MDKAYSAQLGLKLKDDWWKLTGEERRRYAGDVVALFEQFSARVTLRGVYVTQGFRADTDLFLWMYGERIEDIQDLQLAFRRSPFGRLTSTPWSFVGLGTCCRKKNAVQCSRNMETSAGSSRDPYKWVHNFGLGNFEWPFIVGRRFNLAEALAQYQ